MRNNLHTTIKAYTKISPSLFENYVKTEDLNKQLADYVKEAPTDGFTYGRRNKEWVELEASAVRNVRLRWGTSKKEKFISYGEEGYLPEDDVTLLPYRTDIYKEGQKVYTKILTIPVAEDSYVWVCCSHKILRIQCELNGELDGKPGGPSAIAEVWDYSMIPDTTVTGSDGVPYYCYRTNDMLGAGHTWILVLEINAHKESD